jgi:thioredoxin reductase (NADPH)
LTDWIENYPGFPDGIAPFDLMENFQKQMERFGAVVVTDEVKEIMKSDDLWQLKGAEKDYFARTVIIATGSDYRKLGIKGESELTGKGVSFCAICDGAFFQNKDIAVVGGGDNALTEAQYLTKFCRSIKLIHRRSKFRGEKILQERVLKNEKIEVLWNSIVEEVLGDDRIQGVRIKNTKDGKEKDLAIEGLFVSIGTHPNTGFVKGVLDLDEWDLIKVDKNMGTSQTGVFAAGDVTDACPKQMATAVGTGVHAALFVIDHIECLED